MELEIWAISMQYQMFWNRKSSWDWNLMPLYAQLVLAGTYSGLFLGTKLFAPEKPVYGFNVCDDEVYFLNVCTTISKDTVQALELPVEVCRENMHIIDGYKGAGYAVSRKEELVFITSVARTEGVIRDPVYTGKAFYGLYQELKKGNLKEHKNILFFHTGGLYGLFPKQEQFTEIFTENAYVRI